MNMLSTTSLSLLIAATLLPAAAAVAAETTPREGFDAAALFKASCAPCHGLAGAGDGPVASVLASEVPRLDDLTKRAEGVYPADYVREVFDITQLSHIFEIFPTEEEALSSYLTAAQI